MKFDPWDIIANLVFAAGLLILALVLLEAI